MDDESSVNEIGLLDARECECQTMTFIRYTYVILAFFQLADFLKYYAHHLCYELVKKLIFSKAYKL